MGGRRHRPEVTWPQSVPFFASFQDFLCDIKWLALTDMNQLLIYLYTRYLSLQAFNFNQVITSINIDSFALTPSLLSMWLLTGIYICRYMHIQEYKCAHLFSQEKSPKLVSARAENSRKTNRRNWIFSRNFVSVILLFLSILGEDGRDLTFCLITDLFLKVQW